MHLCFKATKDLLKTCAAAATLGVALAPSYALAVTTWDWSFTTTLAGQFASGTFTTADVVPTVGTTYQITGISGTYNRGGTAYNITGLLNSYSNKFQWSGTSSSILVDEFEYIVFSVGADGEAVGLTQEDFPGYNPVSDIETSFSGSDGDILSSSIAPVSPPPTAVPGPLPLLGAAAAFQASRRLRRRLNGSLPAA